MNRIQKHDLLKLNPFHSRFHPLVLVVQDPVSPCRTPTTQDTGDGRYATDLGFVIDLLQGVSLITQLEYLQDCLEVIVRHQRLLV